MKRSSLFTIIIGLLFLSTYSFASDYYIDSVLGVDSNNGASISTPWKNSSKINGLRLAAGDRLYLKSGSVWNGQQLKFAGSGAAAFPIIINQYVGGFIGFAMGYTDSVSFSTIGAGTCTFIFSPITGSALGAFSDIIAISIAIGVIKTIAVTIGTPIIAKRIGLDNPRTAMVHGGIMGPTSGVATVLAATDEKLVPFGALTATFYTGLRCLLCPSLLFFITKFILT